jgi:hypothetical protein
LTSLASPYFLGIANQIHFFHPLCCNPTFYPYFFIYFEKLKTNIKYFLGILVILLLSSFNFYVSRNLENHKKEKYIKNKYKYKKLIIKSM